MRLRPVSGLSLSLSLLALLLSSYKHPALPSGYLSQASGARGSYHMLRRERSRMCTGNLYLASATSTHIATEATSRLEGNFSLKVLWVMSGFLLSWTCLFRSLSFLSYARNVILLACYEILLCVSPLASFTLFSSTYLFVYPTLRRLALVSVIGLDECSY